MELGLKSKLKLMDVYGEMNHLIAASMRNIRGWKKVCLNDNPYLYCCDSNIKPRKVVIISKAGSLAIIITIISVIVVIFIALCSIAYYRYRY